MFMTINVGLITDGIKYLGQVFPLWWLELFVLCCFGVGGEGAVVCLFLKRNCPCRRDLVHDTVSIKPSPYAPKTAQQEPAFLSTTSPQSLLLQGLLQQSSGISYVQLFQLRVPL